MKFLPGDYILSLWASVGATVSTVTLIIRRENKLLGEFCACSPGLLAHKFERHIFCPRKMDGSNVNDLIIRDYARITYEQIALRDDQLRWMEIDIFSTSLKRYEAAKELLMRAGFEWMWDLMENFDAPLDGGRSGPVDFAGAQKAQEEGEDTFLETDAPPDLGFEPPDSEYASD